MSFREISAFFIEDQCLFGAYPTQHQIYELEKWGVDLIVNLTSRYEKKIKAYSTTVKTINFIISDNKAPENILEFCALIIHITKLINQNQKIYIHCKGGHGRSGVLVASILCYKYRIMPHDAIQLTTKCHSTRPIHALRPKMNEYWKNKGSPQTEEQKQFVVSIFYPYVITKESPFNQKGIWIRNSEENINFVKNFCKKSEIIWADHTEGLSYNFCNDRFCLGSSFNNVNDIIDSFLLSTNLGQITGNNGNELEKYRDSLIENLVFFHN
jgi:protein-tyrosine phosphatase